MQKTKANCKSAKGETFAEVLTMTYQGAKYVGKKIPQVNIDSAETFVD